MKSHVLLATIATLLVVLGGVAVYDADGSDAATNLTIYFDGDGGSPVPSTITKANDGSANATVTIPSTTPTKSGYRFLYWVEADEGKTPIYPGTTETVLWGMWTFVAVYEAQVTYHVTINAGSGGRVEPTSLDVPASATVTVNSNKLRIDDDGKTFATVIAYADAGYHFVSWSNVPSAFTGATTITANFAIYTYTITISAGTGGSVTPTKLTDVPYGSAISANGNVLTIGNQKITASPNLGYSFSSWSKTSGKIIDDATITATFTRAPTYTHTATLRFDANGGTGAPSTMSRSYTDGNVSATGSYTFTIPSTEPTHTQYDFLYWSTDSAGSKPYYYPSGKYEGATSTISVPYGSTVTLYAVWAERLYTVTIEAGTGGSVTESSVAAYSGTVWTTDGNKLVFGSGQTATTIYANPDDGYLFSSWSPASGTITGDITITATFTKRSGPDLKIIFDGDGGSPVPSTITKANDGSANATVTIPSTTPTKSGYRFLYWVGEDEGETPIYPGTEETFPWGTWGLAAVYESLNNCTVTIVAGEGGTVTQSSVTVPVGSTIAPNGNTLMIKNLEGVVAQVKARPDDGYRFSSWSPSSGTIAGDMTITASFAKSKVTYIVTYDANGGSGAPVGVSATTYDLSWSFTIPESEPRRSGYTFEGWEAVYNGSASGTVYKPGDTVTLSAVLPEVVLKAKWTPISTGDAFTIYASADGWVYDGKTYAYDTVTLFYTEIAPIYIDGREYAGGHIYLQLGNRGTVLDLGVSSPDFEIKLGGQWAVSTAFSAGESSTTTKTEMKPWGWNWDMSLVAIAFVGILALVTVVANYLSPSGLRPMDWIVIGIAGVVGVALMVL